MNRKIKTILLIFSIFAFSNANDFCPKAWAEEPHNPYESKIVILYTGNTLEEIKPCGCTEEADFGGLPRRATAIKKEKAANQNVLLFDAGDNLKGQNPQGLLKARFIAQGLENMAYDAALPGEKDFKYGPGFLEMAGFKGWMASNLVYDQFKFRKILVRELVPGTRVGAIGLTEGHLFADPAHMGISITPPVEFLRDNLNRLIRENNIHIPVLLLHSRKPLALQIFKEFPDIKIIISGHAEDPENEEAKTPLIQDGRGLFLADNKARRLGKIEITAHKTNGKLEFGHTWIPLDDDIQDDPAMKAFFVEYKKEVKSLFLQKSEMKTKLKETTPYASADSCHECHEEISASWRETRHAGAMETLKGVDQSYDPECVKCHVVGFEKGGYVDDKLTPGLGGVQCESCHGPGKNHIADLSADYGKGASGKCVECHTRAKDPRFSFEKFWEIIKH